MRSEDPECYMEGPVPDASGHLSNGTPAPPAPEVKPSHPFRPEAQVLGFLTWGLCSWGPALPARSGPPHRPPPILSLSQCRALVSFIQLSSS